MSNINERDFKGVWIPKEVWLDTRLNMLEKGILTEIDSLDMGDNGCYASNKHLADFCQCSETKVSTAISKLIDLGYLYVKSFDGRQRILKSRLSNFERQNLKKLNAHNIYNISNSNNNISNTFISTHINSQLIFEYWNSKEIIVHKTLTQTFIKAIDKALKKYSVEEIKKYIDRYNTVLKDTTYFFDTKWTIDKFLTQSNAIGDFTDEGSKWLSYLNRQEKTTQSKTAIHFANERTYTKEELDALLDSVDDIKF